MGPRWFINYQYDGGSLLSDFARVEVLKEISSSRNRFVRNFPDYMLILIVTMASRKRSLPWTAPRDRRLPDQGGHRGDK